MESDEQKENRPWLYKKGQSGNPNGRPKGSISMKTYIKNKLATMTDEERETFLEGIDKKVLWEMGEGKAEAEVTGDIDIRFTWANDEDNNDTLHTEGMGEEVS